MADSHACFFVNNSMSNCRVLRKHQKKGTTLCFISSSPSSNPCELSEAIGARNASISGGQVSVRGMACFLINKQLRVESKMVLLNVLAEMNHEE
jgi:hypothetical protein